MAFGGGNSILRELPFFLDVMTLSIEGGQSLSAALHTTVQNMPASAPAPLTSATAVAS